MQIVNPQAQCPKSKAGFTLIELLVVVAIIAVLISILLPALNMAPEKARQIQCMSNMKQVAMGAQYYTNDHNDWLPESFYYYDPTNTLGGGVMWIETFFESHYLPGTGVWRADYTNAWYWPNKQKTVLYCPDDTWHNQLPTVDGGRHCGLSYYINMDITYWDQLTPFPGKGKSSSSFNKVTQIPDASKTALFLDCLYGNGYAMESYGATYPDPTYGNCINYNHSGGKMTNVIYTDCHASSYNYPLPMWLAPEGDVFWWGQ